MLVAIKNGGAATTEELARETYLSPGAVRQHLLALEAQGLVTFDRMREGPGRPRHVFRLTSRGEELFPQQYALMAHVLLSAIEDEEDGVKDRVLDRVVKSQVEIPEDRLYGLSDAERLLEVTKSLEGYGYFPQLEVLDEKPPQLTLRHCPLLNVVRKHPGLCEAERRALERALPGASLERTSHRLADDPVCCYRVTGTS